MLIKPALRLYIWMVPFIAFIVGYYAMGVFLLQDSFYTPCIVGSHLHDAIRTLSAHNLNVRILAEKQEADIPQGVVLSQSPDYTQKVKAHQSVYLVITSKPTPKNVPYLAYLQEKEIVDRAAQENIYLKRYFLQSIYPKNTCIAQSATEKEVLDKNTLTVYISSGSNPIYIFPSLKNKNLAEVVSFLEKQGISYQLFDKKSSQLINSSDNFSSEYYDNYNVIDHKPLAGSLINLNKNLKVQLTISESF